jgi:DNA polymerase-3 subunit chi
MVVNFYHLTRMPLERALPNIVEQVLKNGERLLVVSADELQRSALDRLLWEYSPESFVPHAQIGKGADEVQPVLIASEVNAANGAKFVALVDGEWRDDALDFERAYHFFDEDRIGAARAAWKGLAGREGIDRRYWKQNDAGRWEQAA